MPDCLTPCISYQLLMFVLFPQSQKKHTHIYEYAHTYIILFLIEINFQKKKKERYLEWHFKHGHHEKKPWTQNGRMGKKWKWKTNETQKTHETWHTLRNRNWVFRGYFKHWTPCVLIIWFCGKRVDLPRKYVFLLNCRDLFITDNR